MKRWATWRWIMLALILVVALVPAVSFAALRVLRAYACGDDQFEEIVSPDGARKVVMYRRDCGATTDCSRQVCVVSRRRFIPWRPDPVFATDGDMTVVPKWEDPLHLTILYSKLPNDDGANASCLAKSAGPVKITCRSVP
jgi:hypothetical protein